MSKININTVFIKICDKLNLSKDLHQELERRYKAVSEYLKSCTELKDLKIYPQGSVAIGTTIKPVSQEEYDLDFVCETKMDPFQLFDLINKMLKENGRYESIVEEKKRCARINYKGNFHLDILPACPDADSSSPTGILIPDKKLKNLLSSDPKGYVSWFKKKSNIHPGTDREADSLPQYQQAIQKNNLQKMVQLMKRHRDIFFKNQMNQSPPSIVLTTLCGEYYEDRGDILNGMIHITDRMIKTPKEVYNPVNSEELLSEKWVENYKLYDKFIEWIEFLKSDLNTLKRGENLEKTLFKMFGETITKSILNELEEEDRIHVNRNKLSVSASGILSASGDNPVPRNTFYGDQKKT